MTTTELTFAKSTRSGGSGGNCVEWSFGDAAGVRVRDSKDPAGVTLLVTHAAWERLLDAVASGADHPWVLPVVDGVHLCTGDGELRFTSAEWAAFADGVRAGEGRRVAAAASSLG